MRAVKASKSLPGIWGLSKLIRASASNFKWICTWALRQIFSSPLGINMPKCITCLMMCLMLAQRSWLKNMPVAIIRVARVAYLEYFTVFSYPWQSTVLPSNRVVLPTCYACITQEGPISFPPVMRWSEDPAEMLCSGCSSRLSLPCPFLCIASFCTLGPCHLCVPWRCRSSSSRIV